LVGGKFEIAKKALEQHGDTMEAAIYWARKTAEKY